MTASASTSQRLALGGVLLLGLAVRLWAIGFGLPDSFHNDEVFIVRRALAFGSGDLNPHSFHWPAFHLYVLFALYGALYVAGRVAGAFASVADFRNLYFTDPTLFYLAGRMLSALLGTATIYLVIAATRRLAGARAGLLAGLALALTAYHVRDSHLASLDVPATFWVALSFAGAVSVYQAADASRRRYVACGIAAGLAAATKYNAGIIILALGAAHLLRARRAPFGNLFWAGVAAFAAFLAAAPFLVIDWQTFLRDLEFQRRHLAEGQLGLGTDSALGYYLSKLAFVQMKNTEHTVFDPMFLLFGGGLLAALRPSRWRPGLLLAIVPGAYLLYVGTWGMAATRYLDPIFPLLAAAAGVWLAGLGRTGLVIAGLCFALSLRTVLLSDWVLSQPDTRTVAREWVESNIPPGTVIALESYAPNLAPSPRSLATRAAGLVGGQLQHPTQSVERMERYLQWMSENAPAASYDLVSLNDSLADPEAQAANRATEVNYDLPHLRALGVRYVIVASFQYGRFTSGPGRALYPRLAAFYDDLERELATVRVFEPRPWQPGPVIRIYAMERSS